MLAGTVWKSSRWASSRCVRPNAKPRRQRFESNQINQLFDPSPAIVARSNPDNAAILRIAKRLRTEVHKVADEHKLAKHIGARLPILAKRDNLTLYTRLVRLQVAAYHSSRILEKEGEHGTGHAHNKRENETFHFVPPSSGSGGSVGEAGREGDVGAGKGAESQGVFGRSGSATGAEKGSSSSSGGSGAGAKGSSWSYSRFMSKSGDKPSEGAGNGEAGPTRQNPLPIYIVPSKLNWLGWAGSVIFMCVLIYFISNAGSGGGGPLAGLLGNQFEIAEPGDLTFDDVKGNTEAKEELFDVVEYLKNPAQFAKQGIKIPKGVLLTGPPGTGKTMLARVVASESGVPFISTSGAEFEEMLVGVGARRVRQLFELARKNAPCIVFIDELDAVGARRDDLNNHHRMSINQLLVEMDGFEPSDGIVVIGATNLSEILDKALIRPGRFDRKVSLELPGIKARKEILDHYLKEKKLSADVETLTLSRAAVGLSGADLATLVNWAAIISSKKKKTTISMKMLEEALFNVVMGRENRSRALNDFTRKLCAYHESGHALVSLHTPGAPDIRRATLVPRGHALGMVNFLEKEDPLVTQLEYLAEMDIAMGGRAAEELIFGPKHITQGASGDFQAATDVATRMVTQLGMSPKIGPVHIPVAKSAHVSPETLLLIEEEIRRLSKESYERASHLLKTHESQLHLLANALLKYESLTLEEIKRAIAGDPLADKEAEFSQALLDDQQLEAEVADARSKRKAEAAERKRGRAAASAPNSEHQPSPSVRVDIASKDE